MTSSNAFAEFYLAREIQMRLAKLGYRNELKVTAPEILKDLKDRVITGPVKVTILGEKRFKAVVSANHYYEALCKRHFFGVRRIYRLCQSAEHLAHAGCATAWTLTTCYYAAFFAALELMELTGKHISYFSPEEISQINEVATLGKPVATAGPYLGEAQLDSMSKEVEITYTQSGQKPHDFAWTQLHGLIRSVVPVTADALRHQGSLVRFLGQKGGAPWSRPNEVRNLWNYTIAELFCEKGEVLGDSLKDYILAPKEALRWGIGKHVHRSEMNEASSIGYIRATLLGAIGRVSDAVLPENLARIKAA
jgi:hypothetical protein